MLVEQRAESDCAICTISMATGLPYETTLQVGLDSEQYVVDYGTRDDAKILRLLGWYQDNMAGHSKVPSVYRGAFRSLYLPWGISPDLLRAWIWGRRAIIVVPSLNLEDGSHSIYYDGHHVLDPSRKNRYTEFDKLKPTNALVFRD